MGGIEREAIELEPKNSEQGFLEHNDDGARAQGQNPSTAGILTATTFSTIFCAMISTALGPSTTQTSALSS